jgi:hypothetical protein
MRIAGKQTDGQWMSLKKRLQSNPSRRLWDSAYRRFYLERINTRYLYPIASIKNRDTQCGEGFAMAALFCTLIEYLESCERGDNFRFIGRTGAKLQPHEYDEHQAATYFKYFLKKRAPFCELVPADLVDSFYRNVRCGLVHEARTKGGWTVSSKGSGGRLISQSGSTITLFRNELLPGLQRYLDDYRQRLMSDPNTQEAFIRKFDHLCSP